MKIARFEIKGKPKIAVKSSHVWYDYDTILETREFTPKRDESQPENIITEMIIAGVLHENIVREQLQWANFDGKKYHLNLEDEIPLLPMRPGKIIGVARNWKKHAKEQGKPIPSSPIYFTKSSNCAIGPEEAITFSKDIGRVDHEGELGVVIGKVAKGVKANDANLYIHSYTIINDITARDLQRELQDKGYPWTAAKSLDTFAPIGPCLALPGRMLPLGNQAIEVRVNNELRQQSTLSEMNWKIPVLIEVITKNITLEPGDIIACGTPSGIGPIEPGDEVTVQISGIGTLVNSVGDYV